MGLFNNKKKNGIVMTTEYQPYHGLPTPPPTAQKSSFSDFEPLQKRETRDLVSHQKIVHLSNVIVIFPSQKYKTNIRLLRFATRTISLLLSAYMIYTMTLTLIMYLSTRNRKFQSSSTPVWGTTPKILWPTILILAIAVTTAIMNIITISAYLWSIRAANKSGDFTTFAGYVMLLVEIVTWGVASGVYKQQDQGEDLWGFACGVKKKGGNVLEEAKAFVDFTNLCRKQVSVLSSS